MSIMHLQVMADWYVKADSVSIPGAEKDYVLLAKSETGFIFKALLIDRDSLKFPH